MSFDLNLSLNDLLLMLPELWVTLWICVVLCVNFMMPRVTTKTIALLSVAGLAVALGCLLWYYHDGVSGFECEALRRMRRTSCCGLAYTSVTMSFSCSTCTTKFLKVKGIGMGQHWFEGLGNVIPASDISPNFLTISAAHGCKIGFL